MKKCDRCLQTRHDVIAIAFKGGYSGSFCCACSNAWNEAYHASEACAHYREAEIGLGMLAIMAEKGQHSIADMLEATHNTSQKLNTAMRELFELAKTTMAPQNPLGLCGKEQTDKMPDRYISPITGKKV